MELSLIDASCWRSLTDKRIGVLLHFIVFADLVSEEDELSADVSIIFGHADI